jgi:diacylglycerol kinase family enzyme
VYVVGGSFIFQSNSWVTHLPSTASDADKAPLTPGNARSDTAAPNGHRHVPSAPRLERRRFLLVHNPTAGLKGGSIVGKVTAALAAQGAIVDVAAPREDSGADVGPLDVAGYDAVIAAGGDGTIRALSAAVGGLPVGIIPAGTGNVLATEIGLSRSAAAIADVLARGPVIDIEGALANRAPFFLMAGAGFDGAVVHALDVGLKRRIGKAAYALPALRTLLMRPVTLDVTIDGASHAARWVVVTKASRYGGSFVISREAGVLKPGLRAVLFKSHSRLVLLRQLLALAAGTLERESGIEIVPCRHVTVDGPVLVPVQIDGDDFGYTPLVVEAGGPSLRLIVPPAFAASHPAEAAA